MSKLTLEGSKLYNDSMLIVEFEFPIKNIIEISDDSIILLLKYEYNSKIDNNVFRIDSQGTIIWNIESNDYPDGPSIVTSISYINGELKIFRMIGVEECISLESGKIIKSLFVR